MAAVCRPANGGGRCARGAGLPAPRCVRGGHRGAETGVAGCKRAGGGREGSGGCVESPGRAGGEGGVNEAEGRG